MIVKTFNQLYRNAKNNFVPKTLQLGTNNNRFSFFNFNKNKDTNT